MAPALSVFPLFSFALISGGMRSQHGGVAVSLAESIFVFFLS
jgi:hypothetical protein